MVAGGSLIQYPSDRVAVAHACDAGSVVGARGAQQGICGDRKRGTVCAFGKRDYRFMYCDVVQSIGSRKSRFSPYVVFLQTVPIVAIAPLLITWFGYYFTTVIMVATIISLFPIISNVTAGLTSVDRNLVELFRLNGASRLQTLLKLRVPYAVSHLVLGMRISSGMTVIGAIIGELFVGSGAQYAGLGKLMMGWQNLARTDALIAVVFTSTVLGLTMLAFVNLLSRVVLRRWTASSGFEMTGR